MKYLIATVAYNADNITNECFLKSIYNQCNDTQFDIFIAVTSEKPFQLQQEFKYKNNIRIDNLNLKYKISEHGLAIQKILDLFKYQYDDIIICENDTVIKKDLSLLIDKNFQYVGQTNGNRGWWTSLYKKLHIRCDRWMPMLQYFNMSSFPNRKVYYEVQDVSVSFIIPSLNISEQQNGRMLCDPGWYFMLWAEKNKIKCKNININDFVSHFWFGCENRTKNKSEYIERLAIFKKENALYLK